MEQSTGDAENELSKTRDVLDQPTEPVDGIPESSSELKEAVQGEHSYYEATFLRESGSLVEEGDLGGKHTVLIPSKVCSIADRILDDKALEDHSDSHVDINSIERRTGSMLTASEARRESQTCSCKDGLK